MPPQIPPQETVLVVNTTGQPVPVMVTNPSPPPGGGATEAKQNVQIGIATTTNTAVVSIDGKTPPLGQAPMAASVPVAIASDQSAVPVTVSGAVPLPTGAATEAKQDAQIALETSIDGKTPALGQTNMAGSSPVVIANNQSAVPVSAAALPLPAGAATEATLASLDGKISATAASSDGRSNATTVGEIATRGEAYNGATWDRIRAGIIGLVTTFVGFLNALVFGRYNAVRPVLADGNGTELQMNTRGDLSNVEQFAPTAEDNPNSVYATAYRIVPVAAYAATVLVTDYAATITKNAKNTAGVVTAVYGSNRNAALRYLQLHNTATTPGAGAVPLLSIGVPPNATTPGESKVYDDALFSQGGIFFSVGIAYAWSTTEGTYTAATAADHSTTVIGK